MNIRQMPPTESQNREYVAQINRHFNFHAQHPDAQIIRQQSMSLREPTATYIPHEEKFKCGPISGIAYLPAPVGDFGDGNRPGVILIAGGAFRNHSPDGDKCYAADIVNKCGAVVLALDHGRTPDVSHPDLTNNLRVFAQEGFHDLARQFDIDESQTVISGSSSGAHLAMILTDEFNHKKRPLGLLLIVPHLDNHPDALWRTYAPEPHEMASLSPEDLAKYMGSYFRSKCVEDDWEASPARMPPERLAQLPHTVILTVTSDFLSRDAERFYARLRQYEAKSELITFEGQHNLLRTDTPEGQKMRTYAINKIRTWLQQLPYRRAGDSVENKNRVSRPPRLREPFIASESLKISLEALFA